MLKETEIEETIVFFVTFLSLATFRLDPLGPSPWLRLWYRESSSIPVIRHFFLFFN